MECEHQHLRTLRRHSDYRASSPAIKARGQEGRRKRKKPSRSYMRLFRGDFSDYSVGPSAYGMLEDMQAWAGRPALLLRSFVLRHCRSFQGPSTRLSYGEPSFAPTLNTTNGELEKSGLHCKLRKVVKLSKRYFAATQHTHAPTKPVMSGADGSALLGLHNSNYVLSEREATRSLAADAHPPPLAPRARCARRVCDCASTVVGPSMPSFIPRDR